MYISQHVYYMIVMVIRDDRLSRIDYSTFREERVDSLKNIALSQMTYYKNTYITKPFKA